MPEPVGQHPRGQRVAWCDDPVGQSLSPLGLRRVSRQRIRLGDLCQKGEARRRYLIAPLLRAAAQKDVEGAGGVLGTAAAQPGARQGWYLFHGGLDLAEFCGKRLALFCLGGGCRHSEQPMLQMTQCLLPACRWLCPWKWLLPGPTVPSVRHLRPLLAVIRDLDAVLSHKPKQVVLWRFFAAGTRKDDAVDLGRLGQFDRHLVVANQPGTEPAVVDQLWPVKLWLSRRTAGDRSG